MSTTKTEADPFNAELLSTLIKWAGQDYAHAKTFFKKLGWPKWEQQNWSTGKKTGTGVCGTACCLAGTAVATNDFLLVYDIDDVHAPGEIVGAEYCSPAIPDGVDRKGRPKFTFNPADLRPINSTSNEILGLTKYEGKFLYEADNNLADIVFIGKALAQRHGTTLDLPKSLLKAVEKMDRYYTEEFSGPEDLIAALQYREENW